MVSTYFMAERLFYISRISFSHLVIVSVHLWVSMGLQVELLIEPSPHQPMLWYLLSRRSKEVLSFSLQTSCDRRELPKFCSSASTDRIKISGKRRRRMQQGIGSLRSDIMKVCENTFLKAV